MAFGRGFAGGLASGLAGGMKLGMEMDEAEERRKTNDLHRQSLGLDIAARTSDANWRQGRQRIIDDATMMDGNVEDAAGNVTTGRVPRKEVSTGDMMTLYEKLGAHDMAHGKLDPAQGIELRNKIAAFEREGVFDAYRAFKQSGRPEDAVRMFDARGRITLDPASSIEQAEARDSVTGMPYTKYRARTIEGRELVFDPLEAARLTGGAKGILDEMRQGFEARRVSATEARERTRELREENRFLAGERRADQRDRQLDIMAARLGRGEPTEKPLTTAQKRTNAQIAAAREATAGLAPQEIQRRTAKFTSTGRINDAYDATLAGQVRLAQQRFYGQSDPDFDARQQPPAGASPTLPGKEESPGLRFMRDPAMRGNRMGKQTNDGLEVFDPSGRLIGHYR